MNKKFRIRVFNNDFSSYFNRCSYFLGPFAFLVYSEDDPHKCFTQNKLKVDVRVKIEIQSDLERGGKDIYYYLCEKVS